jgi:hypothetical protein
VQAHPLLARGLYEMYPVGATEDHYAWLKVFMKATSMSMMSKTVLSAAAQVRNNTSSVLGQVAMGNLSLGDITSGRALERLKVASGAVMADAFGHYRGLSRQEWRTKLDRLIRLGVMGESITTNLIDELMQTSRDAQSRNADALLNKVTRPTRKLWTTVKNVGEAVEAFSGARVERPGLRLILVGSGGKEFRGVDGVTLAGPQNASSLIALLDGADYLVVPSRADNSPLVAYEAASRGVIPIVRNSTGLPEVVSNLGEGHVYDSLEELSAIMRDTTPRDPAQRQRLRVTTRELSDPESTASEYLALYESML